jgi:hypothetical protein
MGVFQKLTAKGKKMPVDLGKDILPVYKGGKRKTKKHNKRGGKRQSRRNRRSNRQH